MGNTKQAVLGSTFGTLATQAFVVDYVLGPLDRSAWDVGAAQAKNGPGLCGCFGLGLCLCLRLGALLLCWALPLGVGRHCEEL